MKEKINLLSERDKKRLLIIDTYKKEYRPLVENGEVTPNRVFIKLDEDFSYSRYGITRILANAGLYKMKSKQSLNS